MSTFITGKEAQLILGITTRQQLHNIAKKMNVETKSQGPGKPKLYLKTDIVAYTKRKDDKNIPTKKKPRTIKKAVETKKRVDTKKAVREEQLKNKPKKVKEAINSFTVQICPKCGSKKFEKITQDLIITCLCGVVFKDNKEIKTKKVIPKKKPKEKKVEVEKEEPIQLPKLEKNKKLDSEDFTPLDGIGQAEFLRVEKLLKLNGTYQELDQSLLLFYAISYQKYINAVVKSGQLDDLTMNETGDEKVHPYFTVAEKSFNHMTKIATALGLGVRNRIGLEIKKEKKKSMMDILNEKEEF